MFFVRGRLVLFFGFFDPRPPLSAFVALTRKGVQPRSTHPHKKRKNLKKADDTSDYEKIRDFQKKKIEQISPHCGCGHCGREQFLTPSLPCPFSLNPLPLWRTPFLNDAFMPHFDYSSRLTGTHV